MVVNFATITWSSDFWRSALSKRKTLIQCFSSWSILLHFINIVKHAKFVLNKSSTNFTPHNNLEILSVNNFLEIWSIQNLHVPEQLSPEKFIFFNHTSLLASFVQMYVSLTIFYKTKRQVFVFKHFNMCLNKLWMAHLFEVAAMTKTQWKIYNYPLCLEWSEAILICGLPLILFLFCLSCNTKSSWSRNYSFFLFQCAFKLFAYQA